MPALRMRSANSIVFNADSQRICITAKLTYRAMRRRTTGAATPCTFPARGILSTPPPQVEDCTRVGRRRLIYVRMLQVSPKRGSGGTSFEAAVEIGAPRGFQTLSREKVRQE